MRLRYRKQRIVITLLAFLLGFAVLLADHFSPYLRVTDIACMKLYELAQQHTPNAGLIEVTHTPEIYNQRKLITGHNAVPAEIQYISITDDEGKIFEQSPPSPLDYAIILESLHKRGITKLINTTRMTWDDTSNLEVQALNLKVSEFDQSIISLPLTRGANASSPPEVIARSIIPLKNTRGAHLFLPTVNQITIPKTLTGSHSTLAGFHTIESIPQDSSHIQMLAHWEGLGLLPSTELLILMSLTNTSISDLIIISDKSIRLGETGFLIEIDRFGRAQSVTNTLRPDSLLSQIPTSTATALLNKESTLSGQKQPADEVIAIIQATGKQSSATNYIPQVRLEQILEFFTKLPKLSEATTINKIPLWASSLLLLDITFFFYLVSELRFIKLILILLSVPLAVAAYASSIYFTQNWFSLAPPITLIFSAFLLNLIPHKEPTT